MATTDRSLSVLKLFTLDNPVWTVEEIAKELQVSMSTAYRYVLALEEVGLVTTASTGKYVLGPAIIKLDRQIQLTDPLLRVARPVMEKISTFAPDGAVVLLCRSFGDSVLCMHQVHTKGPQPLISYERGRPMPLFRGATSRIILAYQPLRLLKEFYSTHQDEIRESSLGESWDDFRANMAKLRKTGHVVSRGEIDPGRIGIAAALLNDDKHAIGSISYVVPSAVDDTSVPLLASLVQAAAREIETSLKNESLQPVHHAHVAAG
ncbi:IclR family transcriptional regulator [Herbaspirillum sp. GCM10030257]|uniref:IclR family transcriptional regulator n=1 Tax=Herbaspirillum sp. GCM10030257 TaxID=3273393 RepID=UPI003622F25B